ADLDNVIDFVKAQEVHRSARVTEEPPARSAIRRSQTGGFHFEIVQDPAVLEERLREHATKGNSVRLLSSYSREWRTADAAAPHNLPGSMQDFCETYIENGEQRTWKRVWNYIP